ncbi:hypothetical protein RSSM_00897 [Rhodopirellula sallentina SM41]|uniref:Uncharacterized protein n=1 Tax=Rhodopirellula sallentina SM41 TaxID=1263870 RepID=M5UNR2_9BACT|nr:hypothetical protein RSSM_00897 [Rhodopirellula sallentina SM41]
MKQSLNGASGSHIGRRECLIGTEPLRREYVTGVGSKYYQRPLNEFTTSIPRKQ